MVGRQIRHIVIIYRVNYVALPYFGCIYLFTIAQ